jgi:hypothetical protein
MALPSGFPGHQLVTDWAEPVLLLPEIEEPLFSFEGYLHVSVMPQITSRLPREDHMDWLRSGS